MPIKARYAKAPLVFAALSLVLASWILPVALQGLTPAQERGKQIYTQGISPNGTDMVALMSGVKVPAKVMPCINCHGEDGKGKPEGGVSPSNITWAALTRAYTSNNEQERAHPPYSSKTLNRAISMGLDPAGNKLHSVMPHYQMSQQDMADLTEYLKVIGNVTDPGIFTEELNIGMVLPPHSGKAAAMEGVLRAYLGQVNLAGGIYNRKLSLHTHVLDPKHPEDSLTAFVKSHEIFAFCGSALPPDNLPIAKGLQLLETPTVGALSGNRSASTLQNRELFFLLPGCVDLTGALLDMVNDSLKLGPRQLAVLHTNTPYQQELVAGIKTKALGAGLGTLQELVWEGNIDSALTDLKSLGTSGIVCLLPPGDQTKQLLAGLQQLNWSPLVLVPSDFAGTEWLNIPQALENKVLIAYPTWLTVVHPDMITSFARFASQNGLTDRFKQTQYAVLAAAIVLSEALRRAGKTISRDKLRSELEQMFAFPTGLLPPLTFGVNRHTGSQLVFIVSPQPESGTLKLVQERTR